MNMNGRFGVFVSASALVAMTSLAASVAKASSVSGVIKNVTIRGTNYAVIMTASTVSGRPSCHNGTIYDYAFDLSTTKGKALLSTAQAAMMSGKTVTITGGSGSTACTTVATGVSIET